MGPLPFVHLPATTTTMPMTHARKGPRALRKMVLGHLGGEVRAALARWRHTRQDTQRTRSLSVHAASTQATHFFWMNLSEMRKSRMAVPITNSCHLKLPSVGQGA